MRKSFAQEVAIREALQAYIDSEACLTLVNVYTPPESAAAILRRRGTIVSSMTIKNYYHANKIHFKNGLWTKQIG